MEAELVAAGVRVIPSVRTSGARGWDFKRIREVGEGYEAPLPYTAEQRMAAAIGNVSLDRPASSSGRLVTTARSCGISFPFDPAEPPAPFIEALKMFIPAGGHPLSSQPFVRTILESFDFARADHCLLLAYGLLLQLRDPFGLGGRGGGGIYYVDRKSPGIWSVNQDLKVRSKSLWLGFYLFLGIILLDLHRTVDPDPAQVTRRYIPRFTDLFMGPDIKFASLAEKHANTKITGRVFEKLGLGRQSNQMNFPVQPGRWTPTDPATLARRWAELKGAWKAGKYREALERVYDSPVDVEMLLVVIGPDPRRPPHLFGNPSK